MCSTIRTPDWGMIIFVQIGPHLPQIFVLLD